MAFNTLRELYLNIISTYGSNPAFSMFGIEDESLTYSQFAQRVGDVVELLTNAGVGYGDKVALLSTNMPNWNVCYFAAATSGMVIVPILPDFSGEELDKIIKHADAKALMVSDKLFTKVGKEVVDNLNIVIRTKNLGIIHQSVESKVEVREPKPDDTAAIIYTSGTTSSPKGVMLSHYNLTKQVSMLYNLYPLTDKDVFLSLLPLSHTYECSVGMLYPFSCGASVTYLDKAPTPSTLMPALKEVQPTIVLSVPLIIEKLFRNQILAKFSKGKIKPLLYSIKPIRKVIHRLAGKKLIEVFGGRIRFFGIGGAKLDRQTEQFLIEAKFPYAIGYGLTETAPLIAGAAPDMVKLGSTGPVLRGVEVRLENMNPETHEGEIVVLSPSTMQGYYKNAAVTKEVFTKDGWFRTKDLGYLDKQGNLYIRGRLNNMIIGPSGENIYPEEIETVLSGHFLVSDAIVMEQKGKLVALVHFDRDELERRYQDIKEGLGYRMEEIKADVLHYVNSKVSKFSRISQVEVQQDSFEKTPTQKIKRFLYTGKNNKHNSRKSK